MGKIVDWVKQMDLLSRLVLGLGVVFCALCVCERLWAGSEAWFYLGASLEHLLHYPWTLFTYIFCHVSFVHFIVNALVLSMVGRLFLEFYSERQLVWLYIVAGIWDAVLFVLVSNLVGEADTAYLCGASGGIMAMTAAVCLTAPNYLVHLTLIGYVKFKWVALFFFLLSLLNLGGINWAGNLVHIYGAIAGALFVYALRRGRMRVIVGGGDNGERKSVRLNITMASRLEEILYKVKTRGYDSLSREERDFLDSNK